VRLAAPKKLHDRLIVIDDVDVWVLTQSLNKLVQRSHATITRVVDRDAAALKMAVYDEIWSTATPLLAV
jgi:hypothetical protein